MKITIKKLTGDSRNIGKTVINHFYVPENKKSITLFSIPEFANDLKCIQCKRKAVVMTKDFEGLCIDCLNQFLGHSTKQSREELSYPSLERSISNHAYEWSLDNNRWYRLHGRNIIFATKQPISKKTAKTRFYTVMEKVLSDDPQQIEVDYDKDTKKMTIWV